MNFLYLIIISPIETIVDWVFNFILNKFSSIGVIGAVFGVSLAINFLALPLYNVADSLQEKERRIAKSLEHRVGRIKKAFKGDERFMMLSEYYRQNNYHPLYVLRSSLSILIEIPFFIAAYHYLSHSELLRGASWWIFSDLGLPDTFFSVGNFQIHVLPVLMTLINFVSGAIYLKDAPAREKIQLYGIAAVFLFLLYNSPSGLVIYWILNNIFSLVKNIVMKMKNPKKILHGILSGLLILFSVYSFKKIGISVKSLGLFVLSVIFVLIPFVNKIFQTKEILSETQASSSDFFLMFFSGLGLSALCGFLLPASVISTNPAEFSYLGEIDSPLFYVWFSVFVFTGFFVFWPTAVYKMFSDKVRIVLSALLFSVFISSLLNAFVFKPDFGDINIFFELENKSGLRQSFSVQALSLIAFIFLVSAFIFIRKKNLSRILSVLVFSFFIAEISLGTVKVLKIKNIFEKQVQVSEKTESMHIEPFYNLSRNGKNVIVLFLDRAISSFAPEIFKKFPEIERQFGGFTYFPNTISFSTHTIQAGPPLMGGYEYIQEKMNGRSEELLRQKNNEATVVMPKLFLDGGFDVFFTDPPLPNYYFGNPLEAFGKFPEMKAGFFAGRFYEKYILEKKIASDGDSSYLCRNGIIKFSVLQVLSPSLRNSFYGNLRINSIVNGKRFIDNISTLYYLPELTSFLSEKNTFTFIVSDVTHEVFCSLNEDYESPSAENSDSIELRHYQANVAAYKQLGKWFDFLRKNGVYDNSRIIVVSDHGYPLELFSDKEFSESGLLESYNPLLLVKDFGSSGAVKTDGAFMTNADTLFIAKEGLNLSEFNPLTGNKFQQEKENGVDIFYCIDWNAIYVQEEKQFQLDKNRAFHVSENIFDPKNWIPLSEWEKQKER